MSPETFAGIVFVLGFSAVIYFVREAYAAFLSPEFKRDIEVLREQRRRRIAARRKR